MLKGALGDGSIFDLDGLGDELGYGGLQQEGSDGHNCQLELHLDLETRLEC